MKSLDVKVWGVRKRNTKKSSYDVRWVVAGNVFSDQFRTKGLAENYRSKLLRAMRDGEEFDTVTELPDSMVEKAPSMTWYAFALKYLAMKWPHAAPNTRRDQRVTDRGDNGAPQRPSRTADRRTAEEGSS